MFAGFPFQWPPNAGGQAVPPFMWQPPQQQQDQPPAAAGQAPTTATQNQPGKAHTKCKPIVTTTGIFFFF